MMNRREFGIGGIAFAYLAVLLAQPSPKAARQLPKAPSNVSEDAEWKHVDDLLSQHPRSEVPKGGLVQDAKTAAAIAEAVSQAVYGQERATRERPYRARLRGKVWTVLGTLNPPGIYGGVAIVQIHKDDGRVLLILHTN